jgi:hypothetical protein
MFPLALLNSGSLTIVLLHFDTDYTDSSQTAAVWSNNWDSGQSISATSKFGAGSLATLGTGGIGTQNATVLTPLGSDNWTIEGWFNKTAIGNDINGLFMFMGNSDSAYKQPITLYIENGILYAAVRFDASTRTTISHQTTIVAGEFTHYALVRNGATITLYLNGVAGTTTIDSGALSLYPSNILSCFISMARKVEYDTVTYLDGLHDEFRYRRREAVYTTNFTPPTAPFTY